MTPPQWGELAEEERAREETSWRSDGLPLTSRTPSRGREQGPAAALLKLVQLWLRRCTDVYLSRARSPPQSAIMQNVEASKLRDLPPEKGCLLQSAQTRCDGKPRASSHPHQIMPTPRTGRSRGGGRRARPRGGRAQPPAATGGSAAVSKPPPPGSTLHTGATATCCRASRKELLMGRRPSRCREPPPGHRKREDI